MRLSTRKMASAIVRSSAALAVSPLCAAPCLAQAQITVDVSGQTTASSDPAYGGTGGEGALSFGVQVDPSVYFQDGDETSVSVHGTAAVEQYTGRIGTSVSLSLNANVQHRLSERTLLGVTGSASSTRSAVHDFLRQPIPAASILQTYDPGLLDASGRQAGIAVGPSPGLEPQLIDPGFPDFIESGYGGRTTQFRLSSSVSHQLSELDSLSLGAAVTLSKSDDLGAADYQSYDFSAFYSRKLSRRLSLDAGLTGGRANYDGILGGASGVGGGRGDGSYYTPSLALSYGLSESVSASLSAGVSVTKVEGPLGLTVSDTGFAGHAELCSVQHRTSLCGNVSRSVQPTSYSGLTTVSAAGLTYGRAFGEGQHVGLAASYSHRSASLLPVAGLVDGAQSLVAVSAQYSREIGDRLDVFVSPGFARDWGGRSADREDYQISVGIRYRLGGIK